MRLIAPIRNKSFADRPWEGCCAKKPWQYPVTVAIPVLDAAAAVAVIVELYRLQTERPYIMLIDTGSTPTELARLQKLAGQDCEVHSLRFNGVQHPSDFPAIAMDLAFSCCRSTHLLATHADCFPRGRGVVAELLQLCREGCPVVGYEITERKHSDWRGMVGHTLTMFDVQAMDQINACWSLRRLVNSYPHPDGVTAAHEIQPATSPNWPDTEILINYQIREFNLQPLIIGTERNAERTVDHRIDHCRSVASAALYAGKSDYARKSSGWLRDGMVKARQRIAEWEFADRSPIA